MLASASRGLLGELRPLWGEDGVGAAWLTLGIASTFVLGLALQLFGLRSLTGDGDYATFVLALGIGNVANALAATVQPVVAARYLDERDGAPGGFLPLPAASVAIGGLAGTSVVAMLLAPVVGSTGALLASLQLPLHVAVGVGLGRLQAGRAFGAMAISLGGWSLMRLAIVAVALGTGTAPDLAFVAALPGALLAQLLFLAVRGAFGGLRWRPAADGRVLLRQYGVWAALAWLLNADAIYALARLDDSAADAYALAVTLGRQPLYAAAPLAMVLLPVARAGSPSEYGTRLRAIAVASLLLFVGAFLVLGVRPEIVVETLAGRSAGTDAPLIRGYVVVGAVSAAVTLLLTFSFALGQLPRLAGLGVLGVISAAAALGWVQSPSQLLTVQAAVVVILLAAFRGLASKAAPRGTATTP